ncbi:hypothetical protein AB833_19050 [Chromatiales bacterium (ex Bugula neritina AB1)]|nr:hypothetical protein AB833_19050 [Chromatiales bacterium (ex Bugula neritina AB1)]
MALEMMSKLAVAGIAVAFLQACGSDSDMSEAAVTEPTDFAAALSRESTVVLTVDLDGAQVVPVAETRQVGSASFSLDNTTGQLFGSVNTAVSGVTEVHLHEGEVGEVGAEVLSFFSDGVNQYTIPAMTFLGTEDADRLRAGQLYVDVHTHAHPEGELRAQLSNQAVQLTVSATLDDIQAKIFTPQCSGCHTGGGNTLPSVMNLTNASASYASLVGVFSIGEPDLLRVDSGDAQSSLLVHKLEGTQAVGGRMPLRGNKLQAQSIVAIQQWIDDGAMR